MKRKIIAATLGLCLAFPLAAQSAQKEAALESFGDKLSYSIGTDIGASLMEIKGEVTLDVVMRGLKDAYEGKKSQLSPEEVQKVQQQFVSIMQAKQAQKVKEIQDKNAAFLEANKKKDGVIVTTSGLQYKITKKGSGPKPTAEDMVTVDYVGTFIDGKEFDSSITRGEKATFNVGQVIAGWSEALQLMPVGTKASLVIPADLAYGENGAPPVIAPNSVLLFEVELHSIDKKDVKKEAKETPAKDAKEEVKKK